MDFITARKKATALVSKLTPEECISQLLYTSAPIERLGIKEYNWWNEALHGVARAGTATVFPQAIGLSATFHPELIGKCAAAIAEEGRAKYNKSVLENDRDIYKGLTYWSPNINIFRDPRWGRGQETFGEDPFLTASMGCAFIKNLQGDGEFIKAAACAKHFAVHSGPEGLRHGFNAKASLKDMYETYLPAFEWAVKHAGVAGVMGAYNRTNGEPCCASEHLIKEILLDDWGFNGYVVSDCGAIADIYNNHHYTNSHVESAALSLKRGCDLNCGEIFRQLIDAYEEDLIDEQDIRRAATRVYTIRFLLGEFEENRPYSDISIERLDCKEFKELNLECARQSLVLLKNENSFLPLDKNKIKNIAAIGPNILSTVALEGNYHGRASEYITVADGLRKVFTESHINVAEGSQIVFEKENEWGGFGNTRSGAVAIAKNADLSILCLGLDRNYEGEEGCTTENGYCNRGDRSTIFLPPTQIRLAEAVCDACENVIVVVLSGSPMDVGEKVRKKAKAIIHAWYPGAQGGLAIAELIAGKFSPSGRLPITFPYGDYQLPDFTDYSMNGRTYRYCEQGVLYPFGFGLSYSDFEFSNASFNDGILTVSVKNVGNIPSFVPIQVYAALEDSSIETPLRQLCGLKKVFLTVCQSKTVSIHIDPYWLKAVDTDGKRIDPDLGITLYIGDIQPDNKSIKFSKKNIIQIKL